VNKKSVVLIPARGGSKGIPKKNMIMLKGKPLIQYVIEASLDANVDEVWVSSDCDEILEFSAILGAKTLKRPANLATDKSTSEETLIHFASIVDFDELVFIQATCPLTTTKDINDCLELLGLYDSVLTVAELHQNVWIGNNPMYDINNRKRRQEKEVMYLETGAIFCTHRRCLVNSKNRISGKIGFHLVPKYRSFDIDTFEDLEVVERLI
jgi:CMP-N-acetylneuraminic acid synthetase